MEHLQTLPGTRIQELGELRWVEGEYVCWYAYGPVSLDGYFTIAQLREIADHMEKTERKGVNED